MEPPLLWTFSDWRFISNPTSFSPVYEGMLQFWEDLHYHPTEVHIDSIVTG
jgi:hypothetical protein